MYMYVTSVTFSDGSIHTWHFKCRNSHSMLMQMYKRSGDIEIKGFNIVDRIPIDKYKREMLLKKRNERKAHYARERVAKLYDKHYLNTPEEE